MQADAKLRKTLLRRTRFYRGWWIVAAGYLSQVVTVGASGWVFGVLITPMEQGLGWSRSTLVGVLTLSSLIGGTLAAVLGPRVDRHGARLLMTASALVGGSCLVLVSRVTEPWQYYLCWAGFGLAQPGLLTLGPATAIANWFIRRRAVAYTAYTFGSATAGILLAPAIARVAATGGWRTAWIVLGVLMWSVAPLAWLSIRRRPEDLGLRPDGDPPDADPGPAVDRVTTNQRGEDQVWTTGAALRTRSFWLLTAAFMLISLPASSIFVHMAPYVASKGFAVAAGATALSVYGFGVLGGRLVWGVMIGRLGIHRSLVVFAFTYGLSIALFMLPSSLPAIYAVTVLLGVAIAGSQQLQSQVFADYYGRHIVGALLGYAGLFFTVARAAAPLFAALVYDTTHTYGVAFGVFAAACAVAGFAFVLALPPGRPSGRSGL